jgi:hypothetical protein
MAAGAVLSSDPSNGSDSCRNDVLAFLEALSWHIAAVEVKLWAPYGLPLGFRKWEPETTDIWSLAEEIAHFITDSAALAGRRSFCSAALRDNHEAQIIWKVPDGKRPD